MSIAVGNKVKKIVDYIGKNINAPEQRLLQGAVALSIQPFVDFNNKDVDDETRAVSVARTIGKIVAGTLVGVLVRKGSIELVRKLSRRLSPAEIANLHGLKKLKTILTPDFSKIPKNLYENDLDGFCKNHINTMGNILAVGAMVFTNFLIDAPLTKFITEKLTPKVRSKIEKDKGGQVNVSC